VSARADSLKPLSAVNLDGSTDRRVVRPAAGRASAFVQRYRGLIALGDQGVVSITNFGTAIIIGRLCGKAELGTYTLAWTLITLVIGMSAALIGTPYIVFSPRLCHSRRRLFLGSLAVHQFLLAMLLALAIGAAASLAWWQGRMSSGISSVITTTAAVMVFISLREFARTVSFAELSTATALGLDLTASIVQASGIVLLLHFHVLTASRALALLGIACGMATTGWFILRRNAFRWNPRVILPHFRKNWTFSKWVLGSGIAYQASTYVYPWLLAAFHGTSVTGAWAACSAIVASANPAVLGLTNYVSPKIANTYAAGGVSGMLRYIRRSSLMFAGLLLPLVLTLGIFGRRILTATYGRAYGDGADVVVFLAVNMLIYACSAPYVQGLFNLERAKLDTLVNLISVVLLFTAGLPAVKSYGASGAAATMLASTSIAASCKIALFSREARRRRVACDVARSKSPSAL